MKHLKLRREIIETCLKMNAFGINQGTSGNVSARVPEGMLITPSGVSYEDMSPKDIVVMGADGSIATEQFAPSSEWRFHHDILQARSDVAAIVHAHSLYCTSLACLGRDIPAFHYMVAVAGGDSIRCAPYATFGTQALSDNALTAMTGRHACLLANHGMIAIGPSLRKALTLAVEVEALAAQYWHAIQAGSPQLLSPQEMEVVLDKFKTYGQ